MSFRHSIRVRYGECDMQGVVFNAHYLAYVDDTIEHWFDALLVPDLRAAFDVMLKKVTVEWTAPARYRDVIELDIGVARWGTTSFDVVVSGRAGGRDSFTTTVVYVSVKPGTHEPVPIPADVREALS